MFQKLRITTSLVQTISPCSRRLASCREVNQRRNAAAPTLKFSETKSCLPCHLMNLGSNLFYPDRHELKGPNSECLNRSWCKAVKWC